MPLSVWFQNQSRLKALTNKNQENRAFLSLLKHALDVLMLTNTGNETFQVSCRWAIKRKPTPFFLCSKTQCCFNVISINISWTTCASRLGKVQQKLGKCYIIIDSIATRYTHKVYNHGLHFYGAFHLKI